MSWTQHTSKVVTGRFWTTVQVEIDASALMCISAPSSTIV